MSGNEDVEESGASFVIPRRRAVSNISEGSGNGGGELGRVEMYERMMLNDVFEVKFFTLFFYIRNWL